MSWIALFLISFSASADKFAYPAQRITAKGITQIKISGVKGRLLLREKPTKFYRVRVIHSKSKKFDDWNLSVDRVHEALVLEVFNVAYGLQWQKLVREELWPEFDIELEGPSVAAVIAWREGDVQVIGWKKAIELSVLKGSVGSENTSGALKLETVDARVKIKNHSGGIDLRGEKGDVNLAGVDGSSRITWLNGDLKGENLRGDFKIDWQNGKVLLKNVSAKIKGKSEGASWDLSAKTPSEIEIASDSGKVLVKWLSGGVKFFLSSSHGDISVPRPYKVETRGGVKVVEGIKEASRKGEVFVRTQSGAISWQFP